MLLNGGELNGVRILAPRTVELMRTNHLPERLLTGEFGAGPSRFQAGLGFGYDVGVLTLTPCGSAIPAGVGSYYWIGIACTWFWVDPHSTSSSLA